MSAPLPGLVRAVLAVAGRIVPRHRRPAWRRQWIAELEHRRAEAGGASRLLGLALGSLPHAVYLRREEAGLAGWLTDLGHSARALARRPGFSLLAIATLAIGIGSGTAIYSLAETLLLRPLPLDESDRLVRIFSTNRPRGFGWFSVSYPDFRDFRARTDLFEQASVYTPVSRDVSGGGEPERVRATAVDEGFFETLRSPALLGRLLSDADHDPRAEAVAVLSESFWSSRFGADTAVVGATIRLDAAPHTVVGVVRDRMAWPARTQVWTPLRWGGVVPEYADARTNHTWQVVARLRPGLTPRAASEQLGAMARAIYAGPEIPERERGTEAVVVPLHASEGGDGATALFTTLGVAVLLVLLIACMNASGLLLTRAWSRSRELSLRSALGAGRGRLFGVLLGESVVLATVGGAVGLALGHVGLERAFAMAPPDVTGLGEVRLDVRVVLAALAISLLAALASGLVPALRASRVSLGDALRDGSGQAGPGRGAARLRRGLVVGEIALSLALLVAAGLAIRGFQRQLATDPGFDASTLLAFTVRLPAARYPDEAAVDAYYREAVERLERHPGIRSATSTSRLPLGAGGLSLGRSFILDGAIPPPEGAAFPASWIEVDPDYFATLGVRPREGRVFTAEDRAGGPPVAIVNERMARAMAPEGSIVGRRIRSHYDENLPRTVVGVIPDIQINGVSRAQRTALVLVPRAQSVRTSMAFLVRTVTDPSELIPAVREAMASLDADVALDALQPLPEAHAADLAGIRFLTTLFGTFGVLALVLAVSGVYGLVSFTVSQRTQEIGVRMAMGATAGRVRASVIRESAGLAAAGLAVGLALAYGAGRVLAAGMSGIAIVEGSTYAGVALLLLAAVLLASWLPASRATRVDPVDALRAD